MISLLIALVPIAGILLASEYLWRKKIIKGERARKFIHVLSGVYMAFWPFYLSLDGVFVVGFLAASLLIYSRYTDLFSAIYAVKRRTYGDILFAVSIIICSYYAREPWIFTIAVLLMAAADGGAALIGKKWGKKSVYYVFGKKSLKKSIAGTLAFIAIAYFSILVGSLLGGSSAIASNYVLALIALPIGAVLLENTMAYGLDNLMTPLFATLLLNSLL